MFSEHFSQHPKICRSWLQGGILHAGGARSELFEFLLAQKVHNVDSFEAVSRLIIASSGITHPYFRHTLLIPKVTQAEPHWLWPLPGDLPEHIVLLQLIQEVLRPQQMIVQEVNEGKFYWQVPLV